MLCSRQKQEAKAVEIARKELPDLIIMDIQLPTVSGLDLIEAIKGETAMPDAEALAIINRMDPHNIRATVIKDNPPARPV